jgi:hypothetical protein
MCILLPNPGIFDDTLPTVFPANFPDESFWFAADGAVAGQGVDLRYVAAVEAAFGGGVPLAGDQISFARIRFFADVPIPGTYTVTHPYGVEIFEIPTVGAGREIQFTRDIGIGAFTGALKGDIGPFLRSVNGPYTETNPDTGLPETFVGDPNLSETVTGSPLGTNFLRVQGPGIDVQSNLFAVSGKIYTGALPTPLVVDRATYSRTATLAQVDVFATSAPTALVSFEPPTPAVGMGPADAGRFFGQDAPASIPSSVTVTATLNNTNASIQSAVTDVVTITKAEYNAGTLIIEAVSSDEVNLPSLNAPGLGSLTLVGPGLIQSLTVSGLTIPPATVTVTSSANGSDTEDVVILP